MLPNQKLKVTHCTSLDCSTIGAQTELDSATSTSSIIVNQFVEPSILYATYNNLKYIKCYDLDCSTNNLPITLASGNIGQFNSMTLGTDGNPIITYIDSSVLKVIHCTSSLNALENSLIPLCFLFPFPLPLSAPF